MDYGGDYGLSLAGDDTTHGTADGTTVLPSYAFSQGESDHDAYANTGSDQGEFVQSYGDQYGGEGSGSGSAQVQGTYWSDSDGPNFSETSQHTSEAQASWTDQGYAGSDWAYSGWATDWSSDSGGGWIQDLDGTYASSFSDDPTGSATGVYSDEYSGYWSTWEGWFGAIGYGYMDDWIWGMDGYYGTGAGIPGVPGQVEGLLSTAEGRISSALDVAGGFGYGVDDLLVLQGGSGFSFEIGAGGFYNPTGEGWEQAWAPPPGQVGYRRLADGSSAGGGEYGNTQGGNLLTPGVLVAPNGLNTQINDDGSNIMGDDQDPSQSAPQQLPWYTRAYNTAAQYGSDYVSYAASNATAAGNAASYAAQKVDQATGVVGTAVLTGEVVSMEAASGSQLLGAAGTGLQTGGKAVVNGTAAAVVDTATLGQYQGKVELISVTDEDRAYGYDLSAALAQGGATVLLATGTGSLQGILAKGGRVARAASGALQVFDNAGNMVGVVQGSQEAIQGGHPITGTIGAVSSGLGLVGNVKASRLICFPAGTPVHTPGGQKAIERIAVGDRVWSYDHRQLRWVERGVVEVFRHENQGPMATVRVDGETIRATGGHPFWVVDGQGLADRRLPERISAYEAGGRQPGRWVLAADLQAGDQILRRDGGVAALDSIEVDETAETVYNFRVLELQNYAVGTRGVLVHNTNQGKTLAPNTAEALQSKEYARRFDTNKKIKDAKKNGIIYDPEKGSGIPTTSTDIEPVGPDTIRDMTGAKAADSYIDIDITGKQVFRRRTKAGAPEIVIQENINPDDIVDSGKVKKSRMSSED